MANRQKVRQTLFNSGSDVKDCGVKIRSSEKDQLIAELR
jgi:DNA repair exonuclease SbcCD ATPase subunit